MILKSNFNNKKVFISVILLLLIVIIAVILFVAINKHDDITDDMHENTVADFQTDYEILSGDSTFLVVIVDESNEIILPFLADFKIYSNSLGLTGLTIDTVCSDGRTYSESYSYGGINLLKNNIEKTRNIVIDRYVIINKSGFSKLTELMGEVVLYAEEDFTYDTSDKTYAVSKGENEMGSDMLYTYISLLANGEGGNKNAVVIISNIINTYIANIGSDDYEKMFGDVTNCFSTDLTISDFYTAKSDIEYLMANGFECVLSDEVD